MAERLSSAAEEARRRTETLGQPVLACAGVRCPDLDPVTVFERSGVQAGTRMLFSRPADRFGLAGVGEAWTFECDGPERFARAEQAWRTVAGQAAGDGPVALYGFAFEESGGWGGYPPGLLVVPRVAVRASGNEVRLLLCALVRPGDRAADAAEATIACLDRCTRDREVPPVSPEPRPLRIVEEFPEEAAWKRSVAETAQAVRDGRLRKAVLARGIRVEGGRPDPAAMVRTLRREYPACTTFAIGRGAGCFLGASPERLVRVHAGEVLAAALAGSAPRGETEAMDRRLSEALLRSEKNRIEHAVVVEALREALAPLAGAGVHGGDPQLLTVHNTHHLYTPLRARLRERRSVLELAGRLHPTPAVGGVPREAALAWIRRCEGWDRGWYAGPVGWVDAAGEGEAAVAIRCALAEPGSVRLFAGCGIVADSDPEQELAESNWKLRPLLSALSDAVSSAHP